MPTENVNLPHFITLYSMPHYITLYNHLHLDLYDLCELYWGVHLPWYGPLIDVLFKQTVKIEDLFTSINSFLPFTEENPVIYFIYIRQ